MLPLRTLLAPIIFLANTAALASTNPLPYPGYEPRNYSSTRALACDARIADAARHCDRVTANWDDHNACVRYEINAMNLNLLCKAGAKRILERCNAWDAKEMGLCLAHNLIPRTNPPRCHFENFYGAYTSGGGCNRYGCWFPGGACDAAGCYDAVNNCGGKACLDLPEKAPRRCGDK